VLYVMVLQERTEKQRKSFIVVIIIESVSNKKLHSLLKTDINSSHHLMQNNSIAPSRRPLTSTPI
jgi:hypothetical protein